MTANNLKRLNYARIEAYAKRTGTTVAAVAQEAMDYWMDTIGDTILEELSHREPTLVDGRKGRVVGFKPRGRA